MTLPVLSLLIVMPFAGALVAGLMKDPAMSRRVGVSVALGTLFLALGIVSNFDPSVRGPQILELALDLGPAGSRPLLAMDALSAPLLPLTALLTLGVVVAAPRSQVNQDGIAAVLSMTGATLGLMLSRNIGLLAIFWLGTLLPGMVRVARLPDPHARIPLSRSFGVFLFGTSAPLMGVVWWLGELAWRSRLSAPLDLDEIATLQLPIGSQWLVLVLLMFAVAVRKGVFPFHSWLPLFAERGTTGVTSLLLGVHSAIFLVARLVIPLAPQASGLAMPYVAIGGLVGALLGALLALAQTDLKRMLGYLAVSQSGLMMVGLASLNEQSIGGVLLQSMGIGLATAGLYLVVRGLEARVGTTDVRRLGGLVARAPRMAALFFLLAVAAAGFPGSMSFIGEDLLLHGVIESHPIVATIFVLITALNGITLVRAFMRTFLGRPASRSRTEGPLPMPDLLLRERATALLLAAVIFGFGVVPGPLLRARAYAVAELAILQDRAASHASPHPHSSDSSQSQHE